MQATVLKKVNLLFVCHTFFKNKCLIYPKNMMTEANPLAVLVVIMKL